MTPEQQKALALAAARRRRAESEGQPALSRDHPYNETYFAQATSGANEGLGNTLGAPVDLVNAGLGLGMAGVNKLFGTDYQPSEKPFLGSGYINDIMQDTGSIRPESQDPAKQIVRRISQEVGAAAIPALGVAGKAAAPTREIAKILASSVGSGTGAAAANQIAPDNPYAEMAGQLIGGASIAGPSALLSQRSANQAIKKSIPTADELLASKDAAYKTVDDMGVQYTPEAIADLRQGIKESLDAGQIDDVLNPKASRASAILDRRLAGPRTLSELDRDRQFVRLNVVDAPGQKIEGRFAGNIIDNIDEFIDAAGPNQVVGGNAEAASDAILNARRLNSQVRKHELVIDALTKAEHRAGSTGTGGNVDNASRQNIRAILDNPKKSRGFSDEEKALMERVVMGTKGQNRARQLGRLSPSGNGLQQSLSIIGAAVNPALAIAPGVGAASKFIADRATGKNVDALLNALLKGGAIEKAELMSPQTRRVIAALLAGQGANALADN